MSSLTRAVCGGFALALLIVLPAVAVEPDVAETSRAAWQRAMDLSDQQRYDEALTVIRRARDRDRRNTDLRWLEAGVLGWSGRHRESVTRYESLIADHPELEAEVGIELATQRLWAGEPRQALRDAERQLLIDPEDEKAERLRALALAHADRYQQSLAAYDDLLAEHPDDVDLALDRAMVLAWMGKNARAVAAYEGVLATHPDNTRARIGLAQNENWRGNHRRAAALFEDLLADGKDDPDILKGLAYANYWADRPEAARTALDRFTAIRPEDREATQLSGMLRFEERQSLTAGFETADDSDDQQIDTMTLDYRLPLPHRIAVTALVREDRVEDPGGEEDPLRFGVGVEKRWTDRWKAAARVFHFDPRNDTSSRELVQASLSFRPDGRLQYDVAFEVDPVLTRQSLALGIRSTNGSAGVSFRATDRVRVSGGAQYRDYSDGNHATLASAGARWDLPSRRRSRIALLFAADWLSAGEDLDNGYYDPERYIELGPGAEWTVELANRIDLGVHAHTGYQQEKGADREPFYKVAGVAGIPLGRALRLAIEIGRSNSTLTSDSGFAQTRGAIYLTAAF